jgi:5-methylcytosine-specific restriction endonuclease McrA
MARYGTARLSFMKRVRITAKMRVDIFERHGGMCHLCQMKVIAGEDWDVSHQIPLEAGGLDDASNWLVAHRKCHRVHTATVDAPLIAKVKRIRQRHIGAKQSRTPMPFGRGSKFKRKMDGTIVRRDE